MSNDFIPITVGFPLDAEILVRFKAKSFTEKTFHVVCKWMEVTDEYYGYDSDSDDAEKILFNDMPDKHSWFESIKVRGDYLISEGDVSTIFRLVPTNVRTDGHGFDNGPIFINDSEMIGYIPCSDFPTNLDNLNETAINNFNKSTIITNADVAQMLNSDIYPSLLTAFKDATILTYTNTMAIAKDSEYGNWESEDDKHSNVYVIVDDVLNALTLIRDIPVCTLRFEKGEFYGLRRFNKLQASYVTAYYMPTSTFTINWRMWHVTKEGMEFEKENNDLTKLVNRACALSKPDASYFKKCITTFGEGEQVLIVTNDIDVAMECITKCNVGVITYKNEKPILTVFGMMTEIQ